MRLSPFCLLLDEGCLSSNADDDQRFFHQALWRAMHAMGSTHPNPAVGAVLVKDGMVVSDGFTEPPGGMHAEKQAIAHAHDAARGSTLYVTLEPCSHFGRTPPCTRAIIEAGIVRVVYGIVDPNPKVCGQGVAELAKTGIDVQQISGDLLREVARAMLAPFSSWIERKRPFVVVKVATSADGFFAQQNGVRTKITGAVADNFVHALRRASDAVMIGGNTARIDDPQLTARYGEPRHQQQPAAIIITASQEVPLHLKICNRRGMRSMVMTTRPFIKEHQHQLAARGVEIIEIKNLDEAFTILGSLGFTQILVEAGPSLFTAMVQNQWADEIMWLRSREHFKSDGPRVDFVTALKDYHQDYAQTLGGDELAIFHRR